MFATEPLPADSPLWEMPNVIVSPHIAASSDRSMERMEDLICDSLRRYLHGQPLRNVVDISRGY